ncbi:uncharacterized protein LOC126578565 [Anopheles aquasalis]|uniref:uncharacterized protein LOC126578565 n=1 Tax=Anopheles aquasalis TaxID=42839 RepID=UPI00215A7090|nr:uncharacterized protein LOC126578565 [Anopheles aquasalis]
MASLPNYTDLLPNNVLCMVFDRLDIKNVKNASLVCKRWNDIIFRSAYIDRFGIYFGMFGISDASSMSFDVETMLRKAKYLAHTDRRYRNFNF